MYRLTTSLAVFVHGQDARATRHRRALLRGTAILAVTCSVWLAASYGHSAGAAELIPLRVAVHVDTSISHSTRTMTFAGITIRTVEGELPKPVEDIARLARSEGLDAIILADRARSEVSYGLTRFSRVFKLTVAEGSIHSYGAERYLERVRKAEASSGVIIIPGAECIPYYRWTGDPFGDLKLGHLYEHMVIAGLDTAEAIDGIPDTAGGYGYRFSWTALLNLIPIAILAFGVKLFRRKRKPRKVSGGLLILIGALILADCAPFLPRRISAYEEPELYPPDVLSRYAESQGMPLFWAHPSANPGVLPHQLREASGIEVEVRPYPEVLSRTKRYDGFAMFNAGIAAGMPGGEWDKALGQYCAGERDRAPWVISECDFDAHSPPRELAEAQTVVWASARTKQAILDALRNGRCYATLTKFHKSLSGVRWELTDGSATARSGETLATSATSVTVRLQVTSALGKRTNERMNVKLVVDGSATTMKFTASEDGTVLTATGNVILTPNKKLSYVRALVCDNDEAVVALNPVFISRTR